MISDSWLVLIMQSFLFSFPQFTGFRLTLSGCMLFGAKTKVEIFHKNFLAFESSARRLTLILIYGFIIQKFLSYFPEGSHISYRSSLAHPTSNDDDCDFSTKLFLLFYFFCLATKREEEKHLKFTGLCTAAADFPLLCTLLRTFFHPPFVLKPRKNIENWKIGVGGKTCIKERKPFS